jgi:TonB family protein
MREVLDPVLEESEPTSPDLRLLITPEPWSRTFVQNLTELFHHRAADQLLLESAPAPFWPDVFVERKLPWRRFLESGGYHILALILVWAGSRFLAFEPHVTVQPTFNHADVIYYAPSEYLPPLDTRHSAPAHAQKADPEFSAQPIISVPPEADNHSQTIVAAPRIQLHRDVSMPNMVAWADKPITPIAPAPVILASELSRIAPSMERLIIAPPPQADNASQTSARSLTSAVIAPPPALEPASNRIPGDLNIGRSAVIAPAPLLSLEEQHASNGRSSALREHPTQIVAPPPSLTVNGGSRNGQEIIALSLHPAVGAPPEPVAGNRRGNFAATPAGRSGASGASGSAPGASAKNGSEPGKNSAGNLPTGLYVGKAASPSATAGIPAPATSTAYSVNPHLLAGIRPPHLSPATQPENNVKLSDGERAVFSNRKVYSLSINMPNLNSAGGSWVIHFAALKSDSTPANSGEAASSSDLSSPVATLKVDPAYPLELMKQNVSGTVILHAVILADGAVGRVGVLRSVDDRLDQFASEAIAKWRFQPAMKNGAPVAVEATFWIPFRPGKVQSNF